MNDNYHIWDKTCETFIRVGIAACGLPPKFTNYPPNTACNPRVMREKEHACNDAVWGTNYATANGITSRCGRTPARECRSFKYVDHHMLYYRPISQLIFRFVRPIHVAIPYPCMELLRINIYRCENFFKAGTGLLEMIPATSLLPLICV